jgi:predicted transcriptional regulator
MPPSNCHTHPDEKKLQLWRNSSCTPHGPVLQYTYGVRNRTKQNKYPTQKQINQTNNKISLEEYIERTNLLKSNDKQVFHKLMRLQDQDSKEIKTTVKWLATSLSLNRRTVYKAVINLINKGFLIYEKSILEHGLNYHKRIFRFPDAFPGFDEKDSSN